MTNQTENQCGANAKADQSRILATIAELASDRYQGRGPGSDGESLTVQYLEKHCTNLGLSVQLLPVPVLAIKSQPQLVVGREKFQFPDQFVAMSRKEAGIELTGDDMVFVGYGIQAPEWQWDDYKGFDVKDKTVIMLAGDPRRYHEDGNIDESFFSGRAMTYYGRWTYKFEIAAKMGAKCCLIIHESEAAGYNFDVVKASWAGENYNLDGGSCLSASAEGWLSGEAAQSIFSSAGTDLAVLKEAAQRADFRPHTLRTNYSLEVTNTARRFTSMNVLARLEGSTKADAEALLYCAHWDHFGSKVKKTAQGEEIEIYSGALDNASGVAVILEAARLLKGMKLDRHIYFLFTTLEEFGLLGSRQFCLKPPFPLSDLVGVVNLDIMNPWGRTRKFVNITRGTSTLDKILEEAAAKQNRVVIGDPEPDKGYLYRSDHLEFMRNGVPSLFFLNPGFDYVDHGAEFAEEKRREYLQCDYHKTSDKVKEQWDLSGMAEDCELITSVGLQLASRATPRPQWINKNILSALQLS